MIHQLPSDSKDAGNEGVVHAGAQVLQRTRPSMPAIQPVVLYLGP